MSLRSQQALQQKVAIEAARILAEEGGSPQKARDKALQRLGLQRQRHALPELSSIARELELYQNLYQAGQQPRQLHELRLAACQAMLWLADFEPRLYGPVLNGSANSNSRIQLLLTTDEPEAVLRFLLQQQVDYESAEINIDFGQGRQAIACCRLHAGEHQLELCFLSWNQRHRIPIDPFTDKPQQLSDLAGLKKLLATYSSDGDNAAC
ncbi:MAG: hypothetical protein KZQ58_08270 [gamma proteobacterium symbiont of Bathyaustriella thionipta]|nr:hypothetical protein [gamma proteobacterium symbiont of Bathyaustriella thionipta]